MKYLTLIALVLASCWTEKNENENTVEPAGVAKKIEIAVSGLKGRSPDGEAKASVLQEVAGVLAKTNANWVVVDSAKVNNKSAFELTIPDTSQIIKVCVSGAFENEFVNRVEEITNGYMCGYIHKSESQMAVNLVTHLIYMAVEELGGYSEENYDIAEQMVLSDFETVPSVITAGYRDDEGLGSLLGISNIALYPEDYSVFRDSTRLSMRYSRYFSDVILGLKDTTSDPVQVAELLASDTSLLARCEIAVDRLQDDVYLNIDPLSLTNDSAVIADCKRYVTRFAYGFEYNDSTESVVEWLESEDYNFFKAYKTDPLYIEMCGDWTESVNDLVNHFGCWVDWLEEREELSHTYDN